MTSNLRRRLTGLLALAALLAIVVGLPVVLLALGADPIPRSLPTWARLRQLLTSPDDGTLALTVLKVTAWAVWVFLTGLILLEIGSRLRRVRTPRLAGLSLPQSTARTLVSTAALLFFAAPLSAQSALAVPARPPAVAAAATAGQTLTLDQVVQPTPATANPSTHPYRSHPHGETRRDPVVHRRRAPRRRRPLPRDRRAQPRPATHRGGVHQGRLGPDPPSTDHPRTHGRHLHGATR